MIPSRFSYERVNTVQEALEILESNPDAKLLAGGHSLLPLMKMRLSNPSTLIDIGRIRELRSILHSGESVVVGALTTHRDVASSEIVRSALPALAEAAGQIGDLQVRNRGTVGGNIAHADPSSDLPALTLAYDAVIHVLTKEGEMTFDADGFYIGPLTTALPEGAVLTHITFQTPPSGTKSVYEKVPHPASGYAVVGIVAVVGTDENGIFNYARIGVTGAGDVPYRAVSVEEALLGQPPTEEAIERAAAQAANDASIGSDLYASEQYRTHLLKVHMVRAIRRALP